MSSEEKSTTDVKPALELLAAKLETLSSKVDNVATKVDVAGAKADLAKEQKQPWWTTLVAILGIPAVILVMYLQLSQGGQARAQTQQSIAETQKVETEELKDRAELQTELDTLAEKKSQGLDSYEKQIEASLPQLEQTIQRLASVNQSARQTLDRDLLVKFVVIWIFMWGIGLLFDFFSAVWNSAISIPLALFYSRRNWKSKFAERLKSIASPTVSILSPVPNFLRIAVEIFVFIALFGPLFDQVSAATGSTTKFESVVNSLKAFHVVQAVAQVRKMLFQ